ncbi:MAG: FHA domain-containing protein [Lachnospiraceae bacterium]|nr:FHA domain-containing protein [Lachnospiraceae bacterium]
MLQTEFLRSLHANYERILLEEKPEEHRYQYCILSRGGIKGLLPCSLRYMNGAAYLYYDITSKQNVAQLYEKRSIGRNWMRDFLWSLQQIQMELGRFLLDLHNVLWDPRQIFQDLENSIFSFLYIPYYEGENSFSGLLEFLTEHIDYEDETLVECIYKMYDRYEKIGDTYLQQQIFEDAKVLEESPIYAEKNIVEQESQEVLVEALPEHEDVKQKEPERRGIRYLFDSRKKRAKNEKDVYQRELELSMSSYTTPVYRVAEDDSYAEEYGQTVYIEEEEEQKEKTHRLYTPEGQIVAQLDNTSYTIGKKRGEVEIVVEDVSISRMHARIVKEQEAIYVEDLNSTNGTFKNGLRLQPYEKRKLEEGDEIKLGKIILIFR